MRVAALQMRSGTDVAANLEALERGVREAAGAGAAFVATPEMSLLVQRDRDALLAAIHAEADDPALARVAALAGELGIHFLLGSHPVKVGSRVHNRSFLFGPGGERVAAYTKMHLFEARLARESWSEGRTYAAGDRPVSAKVAAADGTWTLGLSVCYDLRFPELYRTYARAGCDLLAVPSAFTVPTGAAHWEVLLRARAIETGSYVVAPAQGGLHADGRTTYGHSLVVDPWGTVVAHLDSDGPGTIWADIDASAVSRARARIPAWGQPPRL